MIIKIKPDLKKVESMVEMANLRKRSISLLDTKKFCVIIFENYYEIIKELVSALILIEGFKSVRENSHKDLIDFLEKYNEFSDKEIFFIHDLRVRRNKSSYDGKQIDFSYLISKENEINEIIKKLKSLIKERLK